MKATTEMNTIITATSGDLVRYKHDNTDPSMFSLGVMVSRDHLDGIKGVSRRVEAEKLGELFAYWDGIKERGPNAGVPFLSFMPTNSSWQVEVYDADTGTWRKITSVLYV